MKKNTGLGPEGKSTPTLSIFNSRTSLPRAIGNPTDSVQFALTL